MKKHITTALVGLVLIASTVMTSCKKDSSSSSTSTSAKSQLTSSQWKMVAQQYIQDGNWVTDNNKGWSNVFITFKSDGTYTEIYDTDDYSGTWQLVSPTQILITNDSFFAGTWNISVLSSTSLQMVDVQGTAKYLLSH